MTDPVARQWRRRATLQDGRTAYEVTTRIVQAGDLPTKALFAVDIEDPLDPKADVLARVATPLDVRRLTGGLYVRVDSEQLTRIEGDPFARIATLDDFAALQTDRTEAVRRGHVEYLTDTITVVYDNGDTADAAYQQILARLSELTTAWRAFNTSFETAPYTDYPLPVRGAGVEAARVAVYTAAVAARRRTETAADDARAAYEACLTDCGTDRAIHAMLVADVSFLDRARERVVAFVESGTTHAQDFALRSGAYSSDTESYDVLRVAKRAALETYTTRLQACSARCAALEVASDAAAADLRRALDDERRALADVRSVCPTYTPTE